MNNTVEEVVEATYKELFVKYEKALDKAVDMLDLLDSQVCFLDGRFTRKTKEEWEAWLFKDEK